MKKVFFIILGFILITHSISSIYYNGSYLKYLDSSYFNVIIGWLSNLTGFLILLIVGIGLIINKKWVTKFYWLSILLMIVPYLIENGDSLLVHVLVGPWGLYNKYVFFGTHIATAILISVVNVKATNLSINIVNKNL